MGMKIRIHPAYRRLAAFIERLPEKFDREGETLHDARNRIKAFEAEGERLVVKKFRRPTFPNRIVYSFLRKSKARRSYEHALRLRERGIDSPAPVAWLERRRRGLLDDTYYISLRSDYTPLSDATSRFPAPDTLPVLDAFARFTARLHTEGILHEDFNHGNILWKFEAETGRYRFQLIDINRMKFRRRPLRPRECMVNLRRLSCPGAAFLYILNGYAEHRHWDIDRTLLAGTFFRLLFGRQRALKRKFRPRKKPAPKA